MNDSESTVLDHARPYCAGTTDILTELLSRFASRKAQDSAFTDRVSLLRTIHEIATLRESCASLRDTLIKLNAEFASLTVSYAALASVHDRTPTDLNREQQIKSELALRRALYDGEG
jgi:hypothetical protein